MDDDPCDLIPAPDPEALTGPLPFASSRPVPYLTQQHSYSERNSDIDLENKATPSTMRTRVQSFS
jgi:hypothetical protein